MECQEPIKDLSFISNKRSIPWIDIKMSEGDFDKSFSTLISKLGHPVEEIRLRALENFQAKLDLKIISDVDILQYKYLYIKLLEWFNFSSPPKRDVVLDIILQLSKNESAAYNLHSIGAVDFLNALRIDLTPELERRVDQILENILSQHFTTQSTSNLSRSNSSSCQLVRSNIQMESRNSTMFQSPIFNLSSQQTDLSFHRHDITNSALQNLSNQSGMKGILKITTAPSIGNLLSTTEDNQNGSTCQFITLFPLIYLTHSDRTVLTNLENALLLRDDSSIVISHCHFLSNVVLNDFPAELFLQRSFIIKRLLALLNENNDDLIKASLSCLKDYSVNLQRRIKILRDPACFCPNHHSNRDGLKEQILDDLNNTMTSARSVSSISSATSNGYRHPSQWSLKYDESSPQLDQPSSFDILDFCYAILLGTLDLLRRLTLKDCLHVCLQLNNSICHIIDLFVKHNYGTMNFEYYSVLFYRLHSLIKQQLIIGYTFQCRTIYIHSLHVFSTLLHTIQWSDEIVNQLPQEFNELVYYILMDECFNLSYPHIKERLLSIAEKFDKDNYQVYMKSNEICCSFSAACQVLTIDENKTQNFMDIVKNANEALLGLPYHLNFNVVKRFVNICSKISADNSKCDLSEKNFSLDVLIKYMTHELAEIRTAVYCSIAMLVASRLSVEETVKTTNKLKKKPTIAANFDDTQFVCNIRIMTELCVNGMNDLATKVSDYSRLILLHLLQSKLLVSNEYWNNVMTIIAILLPQLQCYSNKIDPLGQCILALTSDTERENESLLTLNQRLQAALRYLFSKDKDVRKTGYRQCVGYLLSNTRIRLDDFYQFYPADKLFDLFITAQPTNNAEILTKEYVNVENFLRVYTIFTDRNKIEANVRKSALEQMSMMLNDPSLHSSFLNHGGLERILEELKLNLKRDDIVCSTDYTSTVPVCTKIIRLLIQYNRNLQRKFSLDNDLLKFLFKIIVCCHSDLEVVSNLTHTFVLLLFDRTLHMNSLTDQEFQQQTFSIDFLLAKNFQFPIRVPVQTSTSSIITTALNRPDPLREPIVQQKFRFVWNTLWHGNVQQLDRDMDTLSFNNDQQVEFQTSMILNENDRKCFSLTYTRRTIRLQLNLLNESNNHESVIETLNAIRCLLLLVNVLIKNSFFLKNKLLMFFFTEGIITLPLQTMINGSISVTISIILQLLALSIAQCTLDQEKEIWKIFFDQSSDKNGIKIFNQLLLIYENRLNTESNDTLKLTVSNMIKSLLNISITAKQEAIEKGFIESQIDHLKRIQTKLTLFSLQSDKCVSKDDALIDECVQVLSILNNLSFDCSSAKDILSSSGLIPFLHQLWCWAIVDVQLLNVLLLLLTTLTAKHRKGCVSVCSTILPSTNSFVVQTPDQQRPLSNLLSYVLRLITKASLSSVANNNNTSKHQTIEMAFDVIQNCSLEIEGRSIVYKSNFFQLFIDHFERVSRDINRHDRRFLDVIINVSFITDGQTSLLKSPEMFAIIIRLAQSSSSAILQRQALLILRNLAFSSTHKARIVAETKYIPTIMSYVVSKTSDTAYIGLTALWALIVDAQKGKVAVRSSNVLPALFDVKTQQRNKENLLCYHAVSNVIQLLTED
ncbi:unnamed protein product [Rotaria sp. Silwood2]|nr:unnamed protein product [Rotaria sp. Silwood2]